MFFAPESGVKMYWMNGKQFFPIDYWKGFGPLLLLATVMPTGNPLSPTNQTNQMEFSAFCVAYS